MTSEIRQASAAAARLASSHGVASTAEFVSYSRRGIRIQRGREAPIMQVRRLWDQLGFTDGLPKEKMGLFISGMNAALKVCAARLRCSRRAQ